MRSALELGGWAETYPPVDRINNELARKAQIQCANNILSQGGDAVDLREVLEMLDICRKA